MDHLHTTKVFNSQFYIPEILAIKRKAKEFGIAQVWDSKLTCSQLITGLVKM
jgi:hypothetical protein